MKSVPVLVAAALVAAFALPAAAQDASRAQRRDAVVRAVEKVGPAVVNVSTEVVVRNPYAGGVDPFEFFFGGGRRRGAVQNSLGSGVIVDPDGYVLTNDHVIAAASKITVTLADKRQVEATVVGADKASDLAVLKLKGPGPWPTVPFGRSDDLMIGETVIAIGNPFGLQNTVTVGVVSALGRTLASSEDQAYSDFVQTDAAINPGNSGGALLNIVGELVGINSQIIGQGAQNLGFAIPIDRARKVYGELVSHGRVRPTWTGLALEDAEGDEAQAAGIAGGKGVFVRRRYAGSPAEAADVRAGDVILAVDGQKVATVAEFDTALARVNFGGEATITIGRAGREETRRLAVREFPKERGPEIALNALGFSVKQGEGGAVIDKVRDDSAAAQIGIGPGLTIEEVNGREIKSADAFYDALPEAARRRAATLVIGARDGYYRVTVPLGTAPRPATRGRR